MAALAYHWADLYGDPEMQPKLQGLYNSTPSFPLDMRHMLGDRFSPAQDQLHQKQYDPAVSMQQIEHTVRQMVQYLSSLHIEHSDALQRWNAECLPDVRSVYLDMSRKLHAEKQLAIEWIQKRPRPATSLSLPPPPVMVDVPPPRLDEQEENEDEDASRDGARRRIFSEQRRAEPELAKPIDEILAASGVLGQRIAARDANLDKFAIPLRATYEEPIHAGIESMYGERIDKLYGLNADGSVRPMDDTPVHPAQHSDNGNNNGRSPFQEEQAKQAMQLRQERDLVREEMAAAAQLARNAKGAVDYKDPLLGW